jgi:serine O-acetyltransferase
MWPFSKPNEARPSSDASAPAKPAGPRVFERAPGSALPLGDQNLNPPGVGFLELVAEDFETHGRDWLSPGFWSLAICRFGNWRMSIRSRALRPPLTVAYHMAHHAAIALWGIDVPYNTQIGRRLKIMHHGGFFLGAWAVGDDVTIRHCATIGLIRRGADRSPTIGSRVEIGPGVCIVGDITVGDDAYIAPNTVVTQSVPSGATALGNPGRLVDLDKILRDSEMTRKQPRNKSP